MTEKEDKKMKSELYKDRDWLYQRIINDRLSDTEVAEICNVTRKNISYWRRKFDISLPPKEQKYKNKKLLQERVESGMSVADIAEESGHSPSTILKWIREFDIVHREETPPLFVTHPHLEKEWDFYRNDEIGISPESITYGSDKKVWWTCQENPNHSWKAVVWNKSERDSGCPFCNKKQVLSEESLGALEAWVLNEWDFNKNEIDPFEVSAYSSRQAHWKCSKCEYEWETIINSRTSKGSGCPACSGRAATEENCLANDNPKLAKEWHPTKNGKLSPHDVTRSSGRKVWWKCSECEYEWQQRVSHRNIRKQGCLNCSGFIVNDSNRLSTIRPDLVKQWNYDKNKVSPDEIHITSSIKFWWKCHVEECQYEWETTPSHRSRTKDDTCPACNRAVLSDLNRLSMLHPDLAKEWNYDKNDLSPDEVSEGSSYRAWWICDKGHEWEAVVNSRARGNGCGICKKENKTSFPEQSIYFYIKKIFPDAINGQPILSNKSEYHFREIDISIPSLEIAIEYDGVYFHQDSQRDREKDLTLQKMGYQVIRIREKGLPKLDTSFSIEVGQGHKEIDYAIKNLLLRISILKNISEDLTKGLDIDTEKYEWKINKSFRANLREKSLGKLYPHLIDEWSSKNIATPYDYMPHSSARVWWECKEGHEWRTPIQSRSSGTNCPYCSGNMLTKENSLGYLYPESLGEWSPKNDGVTPFDVSKSSSKKYWFTIRNDKRKSSYIEEVYVSVSARRGVYEYRRSKPIGLSK